MKSLWEFIISVLAGVFGLAWFIVSFIMTIAELVFGFVIVIFVFLWIKSCVGG